MESLPEYLFWSGVGVIALVSFFLGGVLIGLALVGRREHQGKASNQSEVQIYGPENDLLKVGPQ